MRPSRLGPLASALGAAFVCGAGVACAQTATPATPAPVSGEPQSTTATYGDWVLRCQRTEVAGQAQRLCEIGQTLEAKGQGVIAQIAFGRLSPKGPLRLTMVLPPNIALPGVVRVGINDQDDMPVELAWKKCLPGGCVAEAEIPDEIIKRWRAQTGRGQIRYVVGSGQVFTVAFSFRGLAAALDNLVKTGSAP